MIFKAKAILFDLDGTLADTARDFHLVINLLRSRFDLSVIPFEQIKDVVSHGTAAMLQVGLSLKPSDPNYLNEKDNFHKLYLQHICNRTVLFNGINKLLSALQDKKIPWGIVTNKSTIFTQALVPKLPFFSPPKVVVCGDTTCSTKPDPQSILYAIKNLNIRSSDCVYIGDAERDVEASKRANMPSVIARWGYLTSQDTPERWGADIIIDHPCELLEYII